MSTELSQAAGKQGRASGRRVELVEVEGELLRVIIDDDNPAIGNVINGRGLYDMICVNCRTRIPEQYASRITPRDDDREAALEAGQRMERVIYFRLAHSLKCASQRSTISTSAD